MPEAFTVSELNEFLKISFDQSQILRDIYIKGEISNFTNHYKTGHYYFTIKDDSSALKAVMFRMYTRMIDFVPENGMKIIAHGKIDVFVRDGTYSLKVDDIIPEGVGSMYVSFEKLKNKLEQEGLFEAAHKKTLPKYPSKIGILTSPTGAVIQDIRNVASRRYPICELTLYPCAVQGEGAAAQIVKGLEHFEGTDVDLVIIARGGGSLEDLMPFNDERLARRIYACEKPIVSAVGHETDYTICDFVSDLRAPTPSAAAELALPSVDEIRLGLSRAERALNCGIENILNRKAEKLNALADNRVFEKPFAMVDETEKRIADLREKLDESIRRSIAAKENALKNIKIDEKIERIIKSKEISFSTLAMKTEALSPLAVLARGYSVVFRDGKVTSDATDLKENDIINIRMKNGSVEAEVKNVEQTQL